ncbi:MAG: hypothetical protein FD121_44 [Gallionellaceae bacterium]|nr:MAG: hypothetical protein FD121_44 [Gallionellaceae bacterium]
MRALFTLAALALLSFNVQAGLNKWVDTAGNVHYSDAPPQNVKTQSVPNIAGTGQAAAPATYSSKSYVEREAELKKSKQEKSEANEKKAQQEAQAEERKRNCTAAQQNLRMLEEGTRIVTYDANGEKVYLDDAGREQRLNDARKAISNNCN